MSPNKKNDTRTKILEKAEELILQKSFSAVGINEILKAVDVPKGSFYHYFSSKEDFGVKLIEYASDKYGIGLHDLLFNEKSSASDRLDSFLEFHIDFYKNNSCQLNCIIIKLSGEMYSISEPMREALEEASTNWTDMFTKLIVQGHEDGSIAKKFEPKSTARFLYDSWLGANTQVSILKSTEPFRALQKSIQLLLT